MAEIEVSAEGVAALGATLLDVAQTLDGLGEVRGADDWAFGPGESAQALDVLLGNWRHQRLLLGRHLVALAQGAAVAGAAYVRVESGVEQLAGGGPTP